MKKVFEKVFRQDCVTPYIQDLPILLSFPIFLFLLKNSDVVYPCNTSIVINKVNLNFKHRFGFVEDVKQSKLVKVFLPPPNEHL